MLNTKNQHDVKTRHKPLELKQAIDYNLQSSVHLSMNPAVPKLAVVQAERHMHPPVLPPKPS